MYDSSCALIANYITPIIGDMEIQSITPRVADQYVKTPQKTKSVVKCNRKPRSEYLTAMNIEKIIKTLRCAFKQAILWELIGKNPFDFVVLPKTKYNKRDIWDAETIRKALDESTDSKLYVAMNLTFACSLRMGEILGLTWDNVHISEADITADDAHIYIEKELTRASKRAIEVIGEKDIYHIFTPLMPNTSTRLILKKPKTDSSIRKISMGLMLHISNTAIQLPRKLRGAEKITKESLTLVMTIRSISQLFKVLHKTKKAGTPIRPQSVDSLRA